MYILLQINHTTSLQNYLLKITFQSGQLLEKFNLLETISTVHKDQLVDIIFCYLIIIFILHKSTHRHLLLNIELKKMKINNQI